MKKVISIMLATVMCITSCVCAFADTNSSTVDKLSNSTHNDSSMQQYSSSVKIKNYNANGENLSGKKSNKSKASNIALACVAGVALLSVGITAVWAYCYTHPKAGSTRNVSKNTNVTFDKSGTILINNKKMNKDDFVVSRECGNIHVYDTLLNEEVKGPQGFQLNFN